MIKLQQLKICMKKNECPYLSLHELGEWARKEFKLSKAPAKPSILNILAAREQLSMMLAVSPRKRAAQSRYSSSTVD